MVVVKVLVVVMAIEQSSYQKEVVPLQDGADGQHEGQL